MDRTRGVVMLGSCHSSRLLRPLKFPRYSRIVGIVRSRTKATEFFYSRIVDS